MDLGESKEVEVGKQQAAVVSAPDDTMHLAAALTESTGQVSEAPAG